MIDIAITPELLFADAKADLDLTLTNRGDAPCLQVVFRVELPETFVRLGGSNRLEIPRLDPGESRTLRLEVRPRQEGEGWLTSSNFVYRDGTGRLQRIRDFRRCVTVLPPRIEVVEPPPSLRVELLTEEVPLGEWSVLRGRASHVGGGGVDRLWVRAGGRVESETPGGWEEVRPPGLGSEVDFDLRVRAPEAGHAVPVVLEAHFADSSGRKGSSCERATLRVTAAATVAGDPPEVVPEVTRILMLLSNPPGVSPLQVGPEARDLEDEIRRSKERDRLALILKPAARPEDLMRALLEERPKILHFSGHGTAAGELVLEDDAGGTATVSSSALGNLAELMAGIVDCVVLNACFSAIQAREMARFVPYVIGMGREIEDQDAREFTTGFYMALGAGEPVERAFRYGCQMIEMKNGAGRDVPRLLRRGQPGASGAGSAGSLRTAGDVGSAVEVIVP